MSKKWTDEEMQFLKFAYPSKDFTIKEICKALNRSYKSVTTKAIKLNIKRYKEELPPNHKRCSKCKTIYNISMFGKNGNTTHSWCYQCLRDQNKDKDKNKDKKEDKDKKVMKKCNRCGEIKPISEFHKNSHTRDGYLHQCKVCKKKKDEECKIQKLKERGW